MPPSTPPLQLGFFGCDGTPDLHLSVDGMTRSGPNLSHWPGNRTPVQWRADLSTGICLRFARAAPAEQHAFLAGATTVLNDHYDTDGFGSLLAILRPAVAFAHEERLLAAAATGDFGVLQTWRGFAIDRIVAGIASPDSPVAAQFQGLPGPERSRQRYRWLLDHAEDVLAAPEQFAVLYERELRSVGEQLDRGQRGAVQRRQHAELGFAALTSSAPIHRLVLNTLAAAFRVLHTVVTAAGPLHRYHDRTESWFELATFCAPPRRDLRPLGARLRELEPDRDGAQWCADPPTEPIPELYFGVPAAQAYGEVSRELRPSRLSAATVERELVTFFAAHHA